jgi:hypothetical protein
VALAVYGASFAAPAVEFRDHLNTPLPSGVALGLRVFGLGALTLASHGFIGWLANPVFWVGVLLLCANRPLAAGWVGCVAFLLGMWAGSAPEFERLLSGYYLWVGSMALLSGGGFCLSLAPERAFPPGGDPDGQPFDDPDSD